jgi:hypothetical protein
LNRILGALQLRHPLCKRAHSLLFVQVSCACLARGLRIPGPTAAASLILVCRRVSFCRRLQGQIHYGAAKLAEAPERLAEDGARLRRWSRRPE